MQTKQKKTATEGNVTATNVYSVQKNWWTESLKKKAIFYIDDVNSHVKAFKFGVFGFGEGVLLKPQTMSL